MFDFGWARTHLGVVSVMFVDYFGVLVGFMEKKMTKSCKSEQLSGSYTTA